MVWIVCYKENGTQGWRLVLGEMALDRLIERLIQVDRCDKRDIMIFDFEDVLFLTDEYVDQIGGAKNG